MMKLLKYIVWVVLWLCPVAALAQYVGLNKWNTHYAYWDVSAVLFVKDEVCGITENGLFFYDKESGRLQQKTTVEGLSGVGLTASGYDPVTQIQIIGYQDGNIDLILKNKRIFNIPDLQRKTIFGAKTIHKIVVENSQKVYLCCDFGIVTLNLEKREISETYLIGENNAYVHVYDLTLDDSTIYAATDGGLLYANRFSDRLNDFSEWREIAIDSQNNMPVRNVCIWNENLWVLCENSLGESNIFRCSQNVWQLVDTTLTRKIKVSNNHLLQLRKSPEPYIWEVVEYDTNFQVLRKANYPFWGITDVEMDQDGELWVSGGGTGITHLSKNWYYVDENICPKGPHGNTIFSLYHSPTKLYTTRGNIFPSWSQDGLDFEINVLQNGKWQTFNNPSLQTPYWIGDAVSVVEYPNNPDDFVAASWSSGVVQSVDGATTIYNDGNSTLRWFYYLGEKNTLRCGDVKFDKKNQLWVTNGFVDSALHKRTLDGNWKAFRLNDVEATKNFIVDYYDQLWICTKWTYNKFGLTFFRETANGFEALTADLNNGNEQGVNVVNCLVEDKNGYVWLGTDRGILVNYTSKKLFENPVGNESSVKFETIIYDGRPLLENEIVTAIAVDGADRKWIGTSSSGVFLMSADGKEKIQQFNTDNSPLNSNTITALAINPKTGEVYIGTDKGLMSYGGDATQASRKEQNIVIFPNPVRPDFFGEIGIRGLVENAHVHITDASGRLIFETVANGGMATWNGNTRNGQRAKPGVYLVFSTDELGEVTAVRKIFFYR